MKWWLMAVACAAGCGCQSAAPTQYVTRDELRELLALPPADEAGQRRKVDALVLEAFAAPEPTTRTAGVGSGATAVASADRRLAPLANAIAAIDRGIEVCANNLANAETTAYKRSYAASDPGGPVGTAFFRLNFEQGSLENTGRQLDVAISGQGFFKVKVRNDVSDGFAYTRNGNFFVNKDGEVTLGMGEGYALEPKIRIPMQVTDVSISSDGVVEVVRAGSVTKVNVGQIALYQFMNEQDLTVLGGSLYLRTEASGPATQSKPGENGAGQVLQGFLEQSNVDLTREWLRIRYLKRWRETILSAIADAK